ncbi:putative negative regulator of DNA transposition [Dactylonectria estremocensis]|uniref:Negative regulator of DNA transposition n=1 Tax=Dactylonectria estremocensis TaxID=1079267 RepID=A0A9P9J872_9HYPO|nr:putative negative regulator of DNA transposition [Dactylonectria estremocensis]
MGAKLDTQKLGFVFQTRPDIIEGIQKAADSPTRVALFNQIASHVYDTIQGNGEPAHKKRRVDVDQANGSVNGSANGTKVNNSANTITNAADEAVLLEIKEISVSVPQRKKLEICFTANHLYARVPGTTAPIPAITHAWTDIEYVFYLPVPEKTQVQHNYIVFPRGTYLPSKTNPPTEEPLVFTVPSTAPKQGTIAGPESGTAAAVSDTYKSLFHWALNRHLTPAGNVEIVSANTNKFHSMVKQPHRPNEKAVHVKAFRGSKDGYLFFLENGILWGYKKPLMFIPLSRIAATSYTSILQRTFNIAVEVFASEGDATEELEFSMLDQEDYGGIDDYIKRNRLQDRSMAEQRKGKLQLAENRGPKKNGEAAENGDAPAADGEGAQDGMSELQKAHLELEQQLDDEEDEDEEDYDPGSEGESEGSGDSDDDDDSDDDEEDEEDGEGDAEEDVPEEEEEEPVKEEPVVEEPVKPTRRARAAKPVKAAPVKAEPVKAAPVKAAPVKAAPVKSAPAKAASVPVKSGWAAIGGSRRTNDEMDVDETFDVVG